jgi:hypothetical protein
LQTNRQALHFDVLTTYGNAIDCSSRDLRRHGPVVGIEARASASAITFHGAAGIRHGIAPGRQAPRGVVPSGHDAEEFGRQQEGTAVRFERVLEAVGFDDDLRPDARLGPVIAEQPGGHRFFAERCRALVLDRVLRYFRHLAGRAFNRDAHLRRASRFASRTASRARWSRLFTACGVNPRTSATSGAVRPSASRKKHLAVHGLERGDRLFERRPYLLARQPIVRAPPGIRRVSRVRGQLRGERSLLLGANLLRRRFLMQKFPAIV